MLSVDRWTPLVLSVDRWTPLVLSVDRWTPLVLSVAPDGINNLTGPLLCLDYFLSDSRKFLLP